MNFKEKPENVCPGCQEELREDKIKSHLQLCKRYPLTVLRDVARLEKDKAAPKNVLKVPPLRSSF